MTERKSEVVFIHIPRAFILCALLSALLTGCAKSDVSNSRSNKRVSAETKHEIDETEIRAELSALKTGLTTAKFELERTSGGCIEKLHSLRVRAGELMIEADTLEQGIQNQLGELAGQIETTNAEIRTLDASIEDLKQNAEPASNQSVTRLMQLREAKKFRLGVQTAQQKTLFEHLKLQFERFKENVNNFNLQMVSFKSLVC